MDACGGDAGTHDRIGAFSDAVDLVSAVALEFFEMAVSVD